MTATAYSTNSNAAGEAMAHTCAAARMTTSCSYGTPSVRAAHTSSAPAWPHRGKTRLKASLTSNSTDEHHVVALCLITSPLIVTLTLA